jgi:putative transposase
MRLKPPRRRVSIKVRQETTVARRKNECWSMDFVTDELFDGHRIRILNWTFHVLENQRIMPS